MVRHGVAASGATGQEAQHITEYESLHSCDQQGVSTNNIEINEIDRQIELSYLSRGVKGPQPSAGGAAGIPNLCCPLAPRPLQRHVTESI